MTERPSSAAVILWALTTALIIWALSWGCAFLPPRAKPLALLPIAFGVVSAGLATLAAHQFGARRMFITVAFLGLLVAGGYWHATWQAFLHQQAKPQDRQKSGERRLALEMLRRTAAESDPELIQRYEQDLQRESASWAGFHSRRVRVLGQWPQPWPFVYFGAELLLAGAAAVTAGRMLWSVADRNSARDDHELEAVTPQPGEFPKTQES